MMCEYCGIKKGQSKTLMTYRYADTDSVLVMNRGSKGWTLSSHALNTVGTVAFNFAVSFKSINFCPFCGRLLEGADLDDVENQRIARCRPGIGTKIKALLKGGA